MRPSECKKGIRVMAVRGHLTKDALHGVIAAVIVSPAQYSQGRGVLVLWDGFALPVEEEPRNLRRERPAPVHDPVKLEKWLGE
jgi:hypothetical protein